MKMKSEVYDVLKFWGWLWVPLSTLAIKILTIWFPEATWVNPTVDTLLAVEVFLGAVLSKSNIDYNKYLTEKQEGVENESLD